MEAFIIIALAAIALFSSLLAIMHKAQRDEAIESLEIERNSEPEDGHIIGDHLNSLGAEIEDVSRHIHRELLPHQEQLEKQVNHLATVQMLILQHLKLEHQIQPQQERLVTIGNLSDLKKSKERSA